MMKKILAVDDDPLNLKLIERVLIKENYKIYKAVNGVEAVRHAKKIKPDLILLDVMMPKLDGYGACQQIRQDPEIAHTPIIMLTALNTLDEKIRGFDVGADDYLAKPYKPQDLILRVRALLTLNNKEKPKSLKHQGKIIGTFSLRGGSGSSTLAVNIAVGLSQLWNTKVVLCDLAFDAGQADLMLNLPVRTSWADLSLSNPNDIEISLINKILKEHETGVLVLPAPQDYEKIKHIKKEHVEKTLSILKQNFDYIILDFGHNLDETTLTALKHTNEILLITTPELVSVRSTSSILKVFEYLGFPKEKYRLVLNWVFKNGLPQEDMEHALKRKFDLIIPHAPTPIVYGINYGKPPVYYNPENPIATLFEDLSLVLSKDEHKAKRPEEPTIAWTRAVERLRKRHTNKNKPE